MFEMTLALTFILYKIFNSLPYKRCLFLISKKKQNKKDNYYD